MIRRRWLVPEVVQTSAMDCGPACLKSLIEGLGGSISYGRLRESCQTDVDGTSIDTLEDVAIRLGVAAEQVLVPPEQVLQPKPAHLPCIAVVRQAEGEPHFVVLWRRLGPLVQVMDPAEGRRWTSARSLEDELYVHAMTLPATTWLAWATSSAFLDPLQRCLEKLGVPHAHERVEEARASSDWQALATLDAVARFVAQLVAARALGRARVAALFEELLSQTTRAKDPCAIVPLRCWLATPASAASTADESSAMLLVRGAVLVHARAFDRQASRENALSRELAAALDERPQPAWRSLWLALGSRARWLLVLALLGSVCSATALTFEALLMRSLLDIQQALGPTTQRLGMVVALFLFLGAALTLELPLATLVQSISRELETRLRLSFFARLPWIEARYFKSRPASDMANRAHAIYRLREALTWSSQTLRALAEVGLLSVGLIWLAPNNAWIVVGLAMACVLPPLFLQKPLLERDLRLRTHSGALSRFHLDALLGSVPIRAHASSLALKHAHENLLVQWVRAGRSAARISSAFAGLQALLVHSLGGWLVWRELADGRGSASALLLVLWVMTMVWLAEPLSALARAYPQLRNLTLRLLEPLQAPIDSPAEHEDAAPPTESPGMAIECAGVSVQASGHTVLDNLSFSIAQGEAVAIVGASGAGKSSLCGLFLGWQRAALGSVRVAGEELTGERIAELRRETAWVEAEVQLWNSSLASNVRYGAEHQTGEARLGELCTQAELDGLLPGLPQGLQTALGEGGRLVSGGEGQRVRLARGMARSKARLVLLDEPFRGLDKEQRQRLLARAREHWRGATLLYVTHKIAEALAFERVLVLDGGCLIADGVPREMVEDAQSPLARLLEREQACEQRWGDARWRKLRMQNGQLREQKPCA